MIGLAWYNSHYLEVIGLAWYNIQQPLPGGDRASMAYQQYVSEGAAANHHGLPLGGRVSENVGRSEQSRVEYYDISREIANGKHNSMAVPEYQMDHSMAYQMEHSMAVPEYQMDHSMAVPEYQMEHSVAVPEYQMDHSMAVPEYQMDHSMAVPEYQMEHSITQSTAWRSSSTRWSTAAWRSSGTRW